MNANRDGPRVAPERRAAARFGDRRSVVAVAKKTMKKSRARGDRSRTSKPQPEILVVDQTAAFFGEVVATWTNFERSYRHRALRARRQLLIQIGEGLNGGDAAEALDAYLTTLEGEMASLIAAHGTFWWMYMTRRVQPDPIDGSSAWTVSLYRRVLTLAVLKHSAADTTIEFEQRRVADGSTTVVPHRLTPRDVIEVFALEYLAHEYTAAVAAYRRAGKTERLEVGIDDFHAVADPVIEDLMQSVDDRVAQYGTLTGPYGASIDDELQEVPRGAPAPLTLLEPHLNVSRHDGEPLAEMFGASFPGPPNYVPGFLVFDAYRPVLACFEQELQDAIGLAPDVMLAGIWGIGMHLMQGLRELPQVSAQAFRTGYLIVRPGDQYDEFVADVARYVRYWWECIRKEKLSAEEATASARAALDALTYTDADRPGISLWDRLPFKVIIPGDPFTIVDCSALGHALVGVFRAIGFLDGGGGNVKSRNFEDEVARRAGERGLAAWKVDTELIAPDGTIRQIDASFVVGDCLWVVECKALSQNPKIDRGSYMALKRRRESLEVHLTQARTLADFIWANPTGRNYALPSEVERIEYAVCTTGVEWIWTREADLWLTDTVPRVCTLDELLDLLDPSPGGL